MNARRFAGVEFYSKEDILSIEFNGEITSIGIGAFPCCTNLTSITIPESVTSIGAASFVGCNNLSNVEIPDSVTEIGFRAFHDCRSLSSIVIPYGVTTLENVTFYGCDSLRSVVINRDAYNPNAFPSGFSTEYIHFYYDVEYTDNGLGTISGKTRTYGTDSIVLTAECDPNIKLDKVMWSDGSSQVELTPDAYGKYTMPDSGSDVIVTAFFKCREHTIVTDPRVEPDCTHTGLTEGSHCSVCGEVLVAQEEIPVCDPFGSCGDNISWTIDNQKTLIISGSGDMPDWIFDNPAPWYSYKDNIDTVRVRY